MRAVITVVRTERLDPNKYESVISARRKERIVNARTESIARQQLGAELAFLAAARHIGIPAEYDYLPDGRPQPKADGYYMSLTHTEGLAACVIAKTPAGIDAEADREIRPSLARKILAAEETGDLREIWIKKESYLKRTGEGIRRAMTGFAAKDIDGYLYTFSVGEYFLSASFAEETEIEILEIDNDALKNFE